MSRIGNRTITLPKGVTVEVSAGVVTVKGSSGFTVVVCTVVVVGVAPTASSQVRRTIDRRSATEGVENTLKKYTRPSLPINQFMTLLLRTMPLPPKKKTERHYLAFPANAEGKKQKNIAREYSKGKKERGEQLLH